jgi:PTH1 family peptidyl-tRNA hydrolase
VIAPGVWLIVGLGNPGPEYEWTPHNAGFLAVDCYAERQGIRMQRKECLALVGIGRDVVVAKPQTFMNASGGSVRQLMPKYEIAPERLLVVYDELALPWGQLRIRAKGSDAGHNGMKSIIRSIGTQEFPRLRIGVHPGGERSGGKEYLLAPMRRRQREEMEAIAARAAEAIESITAFGVETSMAKYNRRAGGLQEEEA